MTPAEAGVRVMAFGLGKLTNFPNKIERLRENSGIERAPRLRWAARRQLLSLCRCAR
jgi:hypothetical protein